MENCLRLKLDFPREIKNNQRVISHLSSEEHKGSFRGLLIDLCLRGYFSLTLLNENFLNKKFFKPNFGPLAQLHTPLLFILLQHSFPELAPSHQGTCTSMKI